MSKSNSFKKSRKLALGIAVAMGCSFAAVAFAEDTNPVNDTDGLVFNNSITGDTAKDTDYIAAGVITDDGIYSFNKDVTINTKEHQLIRKVASGYSRYNRFCAPIYAFNGQNATINMNGNTLNVNVLATDWPEDNKNYLGIAAQKGSTIEVNNPGAININFDKIGDSKAGIVAAAGGNVFIHNGGENLEQKILSIKSPDGELRR